MKELTIKEKAYKVFKGSIENHQTSLSENDSKEIEETKAFYFYAKDKIKKGDYKTLSKLEIYFRK